LASALRIIRVSRRVTLQELETATGVWRPTIVDYEKGRRRLPSLVLARLVRGMGLRPRAVFLAQQFDLGLGDVEVEE